MLEGTAGVHGMRFAVTLSAPTAVPVSVHYVTVSGSAHAGTDYNATSGALAIPAGRTGGFVTIAIRGDAAKEPNETFSVALSAPAGATLGRATALGTILNDDPPSSDLRVRISSPSVVEGDVANRVVWFSVALSKPSRSAVSVHYATVPGSALAGSRLHEHVGGRW